MIQSNELFNFAEKLFPYDRSITGEGVRKTLREMQRIIPELKIHSVRSGENAFDWVVPQEWKVRSAYIITPDGKKICDFSVNNLHIIGYSTSVEAEMSLQELQDHLYSLPDQPTAIPYLTSYYERRWGFCIKHKDRIKLKDGKYQVHIDAMHFDGVLNYGELLIKGKSNREVLISTYICHPSLANNELSGPVVCTYLAKWISETCILEHTYRFIFVPETIGSIVYLSRNMNLLKERVVAGFNVSCVGDERDYSYLPSRNGDTLSDRVAKHVLKWSVKSFSSYRWEDRGSDERQYCAPGVDLPVCSIMRTKYGAYPEYHTSLDQLGTVVTEAGLYDSFKLYQNIVKCIEINKKYRTSILCEPQLGKRGLYPNLSTKIRPKETKMMMNFISWCDGNHSALDIAERLEIPLINLQNTINLLVENRIVSQETE
jgi:aminopeptidase-like protein